MDKFAEKFYENYDYLYNGGDEKEGYHKMVDRFFDLVYSDNNQKFHETLRVFNDSRQDFVSSDRECAAFIMTCEDFGIAV